MEKQPQVNETTQIQEQDPFVAQAVPPSTEQLVTRLEDLVRMTLDLEKNDIRKDVPFTEIMKSLVLVQKAVEMIGEDQEQLEAILKLLKARYGDLPLDKETSAEDEKRLAARMTNLTTICEAARERLHAQLVKTPEVSQVLQDMLEDSNSSQKRKKVRRKRKFRSMGEGGWLKT